jgi:hypothetical protein
LPHPDVPKADASEIIGDGVVGDLETTSQRDSQDGIAEMLSQDLEHDSSAIDAPDSEDAKCEPKVQIHVQEGLHVAAPALLHLSPVWEEACPATEAELHWTVEQPQAGSCQFSPSANSLEPEFQIVLAGDYSFKLVSKLGGASEQMASEATVHAAPDLVVRIELFWMPMEPAHPQVTLDLHMAHPDAKGWDMDGDGYPDPWFDESLDCYSANPWPDWPPAGPANNPTLMAFDGCNAALGDLPVEDAGHYRIAVHYPVASDSSGVWAGVRTYVYGVLAFESDTLALYPGDFWEVCVVEVPFYDVQAIIDQLGLPVLYHSIE